MTRTLLIAAVFVAFLVLLCGQVTQPHSRADLVYVNPSGIHTLDPARMSWTQDFRLALNLWEGLTSWDPKTLAPLPAAAEQASISPDGLEYTFLIRDDARWSNGDPVTAADFVRGWRRAFEPGTAADYAFFFTEHISGAVEYFYWRNEAVSTLAAMRAGAATGRKADAEAVSLSDFLAEHASRMDAEFAKVGLRAEGSQLVVHLREPCAYFLDLTASPAFLPCHESIERLRMRYAGLPLTAEGLVVYDSQWTKPDYDASGYRGLITNGPYHLSHWAFRRKARLEINPFHRNASKIACRTVDMLEYPNVSASLMAYEAGEVDFLTDMSVPYDHELARLARSGERSDFRICQVLATYFLNFNCASAEVDGRLNPFVDPVVRRAFTLATDRRALVEGVLGRGDRVACSLVPPDSILGYVPPAGLSHDVLSARQLLAEAGYPDGTGFPEVEILCTFNDERIVQALARMWVEALNVRVEIRTQESKTLAQDKADGRYMVARGNWYADYTDPTTFLNCQTTADGNNDTGYSSAEYDDLLKRAARSVDSDARMRLLAEAEAILVERDCPILPIYHYAQLLAIKPQVQGLEMNSRLWFPFQYVTIQR